MTIRLLLVKIHVKSLIGYHCTRRTQVTTIQSFGAETTANASQVAAAAEMVCLPYLSTVVCMHRHTRTRHYSMCSALAYPQVELIHALHARGIAFTRAHPDSSSHSCLIVEIHQVQVACQNVGQSCTAYATAATGRRRASSELTFKRRLASRGTMRLFRVVVTEELQKYADQVMATSANLSKEMTDQLGEATAVAAPPTLDTVAAYQSSCIYRHSRSFHSRSWHSTSSRLSGGGVIADHDTAYHLVSQVEESQLIMA